MARLQPRAVSVAVPLLCSTRAHMRASSRSSIAAASAAVRSASVRSDSENVSIAAAQILRIVTFATSTVLSMRKPVSGLVGRCARRNQRRMAACS